MSFSFCKQLASTVQRLFCSTNSILLSIAPCLFSLLFILNIETAYAQKEPTKSYKIKASFLLQFTSYATWPPTSSNNEANNIYICIVGYDPFRQFIDDMVTVRPTNRKGQKISIRRITVGENLTNCHVVFITERSIDDSFWQSLPADHAYLLVSEYNGFLQQGGMISLKEDKKHIQLNINLQNSNNKKIIISPELLRVSTIITTLAPKE